ncbi:ABC transporter ATP-binding protein [Mobilitalea sibirica]|uniref:ABC transporter ATP-binding protein n=1 Tax=Mobilitalea sibirica TaxID=1462919 RepID=A0A8J7KVV5_9FIRM|nr:ABC transporter ATP-binding protein [Mobilitalea sibirica]MBH1940600.1 ABC transporter ATP-binding protein [Mobilitalea sibirica]
MKKVFTYLKPYSLRMFFGFTIKVLGTFMDLGLPWVLAYIIDEIIPKQKVSFILWWGVVMIALSIGARTFNIIANRMAARVARNTIETLRHDLFQKILSLSGTQLDHFTVPSLETRMTSDTYNIHNMIGMMQRIGVRAPIILIGGIVITSTLEPVLTLVLIGVMPFLAIVVYLVSKKGIPLYTGLQLSTDRLIRVVRENITGIRVIKALSKTSYEKKRFSDRNDEVVSKELKAGTTMAITNPVMNLLLNIGLTLVVIVGAFRVDAGASQPGKIVALLSYFAIMLQAVMAITRIFVIFSKASASASRIAEVLNTEEDLKTQQIDRVDSDYHIEFHHVSFAYTSEPCITDIHFGIKKGESLGIIGSTGSGKTTLIHLLMRFYDVTEGKIMLEGKDIKSIDKQELRRRFGIAFQNDALFADRVYENISLGRELPIHRVKEATEDAQAAEFISQLEKELDFKLAIKGSNLSGGQKQRLLVSRALAGEPEILILDDSSSALDYKTDSLLRKAIRENYKDTTSIIIAQRISSVMKLDHILVIEDGQMAGYGTHEELLKNCEVYQEIYQSQLMS